VRCSKGFVAAILSQAERRLRSFRELVVPRIDRAKLVEQVRQKLALITADKKLSLLPMPHDVRAGRITDLEREEYRQRRDAHVAANKEYVERFKRLSRDQLKEGWDLIGPVLPSIKRTDEENAEQTEEESTGTAKEENAERTAEESTGPAGEEDTGGTEEESAEPAGEENTERTEEERTALVLLTILFFRAAQEKRRVSYNDVFDTLCRAYSDHFIASRAHIVRDMRPLTAKLARRDLLLNNINVNDLWKFMVTTWPADKRRLYSIGRENTGLAEYITVDLHPGLPNLRRDAFCAFLERHGEDLYRPRGMLLSFADDAAEDAEPGQGQICRYCAEVPYNLVEVGEVSLELLKLQSQARLFFDIDAFREDYEAAQSRMEAKAELLEKQYLIDPEQSDQRRKPKSRVAEAPHAAKGKRAKVVEYWSPREATLYHRSIERGLQDARPQPDSPVAEMVSVRLRKKPREWAARHTRFVKWQKNHGRLPHVDELSVERICEAATAAWPWREDARAELAVYDRARQLVRTYQAVYAQIKGQTGIKSIKSDFVRLINRRYQPRHMWPSYVSARPMPDGAMVSAVSEDLSEPDSEADDSEEQEARTHRKRWFKVADAETGLPGELISRDISSSQTQIVATLLGIEELEQLTMASSTDKPFKEWLAERAFEMHSRGEVPKRRRSNGGNATEGSENQREQQTFLRVVRRPTERLSNYTGSKDRRLQNLCKTLWMTASYGADLEKVHKLQRNDPETFGPGWTIASAGLFLHTINKRFREMNTFLQACRYIANRVADLEPTKGLELTDPSDGSRVRWNPVHRADRVLSNNGKKLILSLPAAKDVTDELSLGDRYPVDRNRLRRMTAPCLVHMLDAYFSTLVMQQLARRGARNFVGIHDCWYVPERIKSNGCILEGEKVLQSAIDDAAAEWYRGLGPVYDRLLVCVAGNDRFERLIKDARRRWQERRDAGYIPRFLSKPG
jgi:hypothetical protein